MMIIRLLNVKRYLNMVLPLILVLISLSTCVRKAKTRTEIPLSQVISNSNELSPDSVRNYLLDAIDTIKKNSIHSAIMNWDSTTSIALKRAAGGQTFAQTYPAIKEILISLGDKHSFFKTPKDVKMWTGTGAHSAENVRYPTGRLTEERYAVISLRTFAYGDTSITRRYAESLQQTIKKLDEQDPVLWIIDLRYNRGGNLWPMIAGLGPLFETDKVLGALYSNDGKVIEWKYSAGRVTLGPETLINIQPAYKVKNKSLPIALFTSKHTASAAEAIVLSFSGRKNVKIFGEPTAGLTTGNSDHSLKDSAQIILTTSVMTDSKYRKYGQEIKPHVDLSKTWYYFTWLQFVILKSCVDEWFAQLSGG